MWTSDQHPVVEKWLVTTSDTHDIHAYVWGDAGPVVLLAHGFGDHGRALPYRRLAAALRTRGCRLVTYDHRGHGASRHLGPRVRWSQVVTDFAWMYDAVTTRLGAPPVPAGISMGALVLLDWLTSGVTLPRTAVAMAAPIGALGASRVAIVAGHLLGRVWPTLPIHPRLDPAAIATDPILVRHYTSDPLFHMDMRAGFGAGLLDAATRVRRDAGRLTSAVMCLHGAADTMARWDTAFVERAPRHLVRVRLFDHTRHNLLLEPVVDDVARLIGDLAGGASGPDAPPALQTTV